MKTLKIFLVILLILIVAKAYALKPQAVPEALQQEAGNAQLIYKGKCPHQGREENCLVAYDPTTDVFWILLYNSDGVLFRVVELKEGKETTRWTHSELYL